MQKQKRELQAKFFPTFSSKTVYGTAGPGISLLEYTDVLIKSFEIIRLFEIKNNTLLGYRNITEQRDYLSDITELFHHKGVVFDLDFYKTFGKLEIDKILQLDEFYLTFSRGRTTTDKELLLSIADKLKFQIFSNQRFLRKKLVMKK